MVAAMIPHDDARRSKRRADFGFKTVSESEKPGLVRALFDNVAARYDLMNDLLSAGVHRLWKDALVDLLEPRPGLAYLDVAGGTGDIARRIAERLSRTETPSSILVLDSSSRMIEEGRSRALDRGLLHGLRWVLGEAERLPLAERSIDAYTVAFGVRNLTRIDEALAETYRVLKPGGRFLCLEFCPAVHPALAPLYEAYSFRLVPLLGALVQHDRASYEYLVESIRRFPPPQRFAAMIEAAGLSRVRVRKLSGGIAALHSAWRL
jgi:demethylmenaquinone methyltransferase/2-methoxy-6-polyprenyl-1,4-benzoquinol methylase